MYAAQNSSPLKKAARGGYSFFSSRRQICVPTVHEVLQADWQEVGHSRQPSPSLQNCIPRLIVLTCCINNPSKSKTVTIL